MYENNVPPTINRAINLPIVLTKANKILLVPGGLSSKFTTSENPSILSWLTLCVCVCVCVCVVWCVCVCVCVCVWCERESMCAYVRCECECVCVWCVRVWCVCESM